MKLRLTSFLAFVCMLAGHAQELPIYSQYILNPYLINPAVAGIAGCGIAQTLTRVQWLGINDAPQTYTMSYHQGIEGVGLGCYLYSDRNGSNQNVGGQVTFAYHIRLDQDKTSRKQLSFGASAIFSQKSTDQTGFTQNGYDPALSRTMNKELNANANFGVYLIYNNLFAGASCANLLPNSNSLFYTYRNFFTQCGYTFAFQNNYTLEPSVTFKFNELKSKHVDANLKMYWPGQNEKRYWAALSYRRTIGQGSQSMSIMPIIGINMRSFRIAYAFDYGLTSLQSFNYGSHELMLLYNLCDFSRMRVNCPAYSNGGVPRSKKVISNL